MPHPLYVAFVWHQHQPLYKSRVAQGTLADPQYRLPWVRLHGTKDYLDLVLLLESYPKLHQTVNLVPSLILQIEDYVAGRAIDPYLAVALSPVEELTLAQKEFIANHFFDGNHRTLVDPHPRYSELFQQRQDRGWRWCLENWSHQDFSDLLAWHNLAWLDPLFWDDPQIAEWLERGKGFNLGDRQQIYAKQREILSRIIPQHRKMQEAGQLEVITSPYTHPILPLLADTDSGRVAVPDMVLPKHRFEWVEDVPRHLQKARHLYEERFGQTPRGLWPSEQSVSPVVLPHITQQGFRWICTDEAILGWTLQHFFHRDESGNLYEPQLLYRPYRLETSAGDLAIVFRDHRLSDLIGFTYGAMEPKQAARDLVGHLEAIARSLRAQQAEPGTSLEEPWLVKIALDGENCWEYYPLDGKPFLEQLYGILSNDPQIQLVTVSEFIEQFPPTATLPAPALHSGSWVDGSFTTWIGDPVKNRAWDLLAEARVVLAAHPEATEEKNPAVWEALYAAEGSDWFWWFGEGHSSNQDAIFDQLFREHLIAIYEALGETVPAVLYQPLEDHGAGGDRPPESFIHPVIDGRGDQQDWNHAGRIEVGGARGTMHRASAVQRIWYGVDHLSFYLRLDFSAGIKIGSDIPPEFNLLWYYPDRITHNSPIPLAELPSVSPLDYHYHHHLGINLLTGTLWFQEAGEYFRWHSSLSRAQIGLDQCLEIAVPWADLHMEPDSSLAMFLAFSDGGRYRSHLPENGLISIRIP
jgi:alpha-amylase/alpha-mannosidase (GH57 family)